MPKSSTPAFAETVLYPPVRDYLVARGYTVRSEVHHCDIVAVKGEEVLVIELKRTLSLALLAQALTRQRITDSVYLAIPRPTDKRQWLRHSREVRGLLRRLELGLLLVAPEGKPAVEVILHPLPFTRQRRKAPRRAVLEEMAKRSADFNTGGSTRRKLVTAYRENAIQIACCLAAHGPLTPKQLRAHGTGAKTLAILARNVYGWFDHPARGRYALNERGRTELQAYAHVAEKYRGQGETTVE